MCGYLLRSLLLLFITAIKLVNVYCTDYLVIPNVQKFCKGNSIISADAKRDEKEAREVCNKLAKCNLISALFESTMVYDTGDHYKFSWLCSDDFTNLSHSQGWTTLVKADFLQKYTNNLNMLLNVTTECDVTEELPIDDVIALDNITGECIKDPNCYLFLSTTTSIKRCKGKLGKNITPSPGSFVLYKNSPDQYPIKEKYSYTRVPYSQSYLHGPLTPDNFYNGLPRGTLVAARRIRDQM